LKITATIISLNEERNIARAIESLRCCDEIVILDSGSADRTVELAEKLGARVIESPWRGYAGQKNWAAEQASHDWILSLDADERVTPDLAREIQALLGAPASPARAGYRIPRVTWHLGRWIWHTDWYPDYQLRLYDRRRARWRPRRVHESVEVDGGDYGHLAGDLQHYAYRDEAHHRQTMERYTTLAAEEMHASGRRAGLASLALHPLAAFLRNYVLRAGFLDGRAGLTISAMNARYVYLKFTKLRALQRAAAAARGRRAGSP